MNAEQSTLKLEEINSLSETILSQRLNDVQGFFSFTLPMPSIGSANDPADIAIDYLQAAHFGQQLNRFCDSLTASLHREGIEYILQFVAQVKDSKGFIGELKRLAELECDEMPEETADFFDQLFETSLFLPEFGDAYMANFLHGSFFEEEREEWLTRFPIWEFDIWKSFASGKFGCDFFTSDDTGGLWIVMGGRSVVDRLLPAYGGLTIEGSALFAAKCVKLTGSPSAVVSAHSSVELPVFRLSRALHCLQVFLAPEEEIKASTPELRKYWNRFACESDTDEGECYGFRWLMTESGETLICGDDNVNFVFFNNERFRPDSIVELLASHEDTLEQMRTQIGLHQSPFVWSSLTSSMFEELCYDVILRCGRFDERTIRRHGRTCSRDGGRDIEVWTMPRMGNAAKRWIFQCKFITNGKSLSASRVSISDVIDQYDADGFGILTNEVIDSTLYDRLDAICSNRNVLSETWDGLRLQRFLLARRDLVQRYFPDGHSQT